MNQSIPALDPATPVSRTLDSGADPPREWLAQLQLDLALRRRRTQVIRANHRGPLRIQRPFHPEGDCAHIYLLHPPGGMAPGDTLALGVNAGAGAAALLTTPAAGKIYRSDARRSNQRQSIVADLAGGSCLEWLPQETIVFSGAEVELVNDFHLRGDARLIAWDIICLGRRASGERFCEGNCRQYIDVSRDGKPLLRERCHWSGDSPMLHGNWGMGANVVAGTLFATVETTRQQLDDWRAGLSALNLPGEWGISQKPDVLLVRHLGVSAESCRRGFEWLWARLRPLVNGRPACRPRIWNT